MKSSVPSSQHSSYRGWRGLVAVFVLALLVRGGVLLLLPDGLYEDTDAYGALAENLASHGVYGQQSVPTAYRPPLYPLLLRLVSPRGTVWPETVAVLHFVLGVCTAWLTLVLARCWKVERRAWLAVILVAADPVLLNQSVHVMTETLATFLAVVCLIQLTQTRRSPTTLNALLAGVFLALAVLCRPTFLPWLIMVFIFISVGVAERNRALRCSAAFAIAVLLVIAPWAVRNLRQLGRPVVGTTHGGFTLLLANNPEFYRFLRSGHWGDVWDSQNFVDNWRLRAETDYAESLGVNDPDSIPGQESWEVFRDRHAYGEAQRNMQNDKPMFVYSCLVRTARFWGLVPHRVSADESPRWRMLRYAIGVWYAIVFALAAIGAVRSWINLGRAPWIYGLLLVLSLTAIHAIYWSNLRMRAPLVPLVSVLAAVGATPRSSTPKT